MTLKPGFYRFFVDRRTIESHAHSLRNFFRCADLLPVRVDPDYCQDGFYYVVQVGDDRPTDTLIHDLGLIWDSPECRFSLELKADTHRLTEPELRVLEIAKRLAYQSDANLAIVLRNIKHLKEVVATLPTTSDIEP